MGLEGRNGGINGGGEAPHIEIETSVIWKFLQMSLEGGRAVRTEALIFTLISYQAATVINGLLPQGANYAGEETLAKVHPSFHFAKARRDKWLSVWTWKTTV